MYSLNEKLLADVEKKLKQGKTQDEKTLSELRSRFGEKLERAQHTLEEGHIKKYIFKPSGRVIWIVVGRARDYQVMPRLFCMCDDFYLNVVIRRTENLCYHILAQMLAEATKRFDSITERDEKYELFMREWSGQSEEST